VEYPVYRLWTEAITAWLETFGARFSDVQRRKLFGSSAPYLARISPPIARLLDIGYHPVGKLPGAARGELHRAIIHFWLTAGRSTTLLVVLENTHLADWPSQFLLNEIAACDRSAHLLVVATGRECLNNRRAENPGVVLPLKRFDRSATAELLRGTGIQTPPELANAVYLRTGGLPIFIVEVARLLRQAHTDEDGRVIEDEFWSRDVPSRIRPFVEQALVRAGIDDRRPLVAAALLGMQFSAADVASSVGAESIRELMPIFERAAAQGILTEDNPRGVYAFSHALVKDTFLNLMPATEIARMSSRVGRMLVAKFDGSAEHSHQVSGLLLRSAYSEDVLKGIEYAIQSGSATLDNYGWERARAIFNALATRYRDYLTPEQSAAVGLGMGTALSRIGERIESLRFLRAAFRHYAARGDLDKMVQIALVPIDTELGDDSYLSIIEQTISAVGERHPAFNHLRLIYGVGLFGARGNYDAAEEILSGLRANAAAVDDAGFDTQVIPAYAYTLVRLSRFDEAISLCRRVLRRTKRDSDRYAECHACFVLAQAYLLKGDTRRAYAYAVRSRESVRALHDTLLTCTGIAQTLRFRARTGDWDSVRKQTDEGFRFDDSNELLLPIRIIAEYQEGAIEVGDRFLERLSRAALKHETAISLVQVSLAALRITRIWATSNQNGYYEARERCLQILRARVHPAIEIRALICLAYLSSIDRDIETARAVFERLTTIQDLHLIRRYRLSRGIAIAADVLGKTADAMFYFEDAIDDCRKIEDQPELAWSLTLSAESAASRQLRSEKPLVKRMQDEALEIAVSLGMRPLANRIRGQLRTIPDPNFDQPQDASVERLSHREAQVLRFVAEGSCPSVFTPFRIMFIM
jgi:tetratricopeptide (TPR) repeat protein